MKNTILKTKINTNCLRKYRKVRGLNQKEAASILGLHNTSMISRWEHGRNLPTALNLFKLAAMYRILVDALYIDLIHEIKEEKVLHNH